MSRMDDFEREIIKYGIDSSCEWFGHKTNDEFTKSTHKVLLERHPDMFAVQGGAVANEPPTAAAAPETHEAVDLTDDTINW